MRVLVVYGSRRGGTEGIARTLGDALREEGLEVDVTPAGNVGDPGAYDAVLVGGALYAGRWHSDARRFVTRNAEALRGVPVWLFSSGPLGDSATRPDIPPTAQVRSLMARVGARGHATFGGRLEKDARGFIARAMARTSAGDWRDEERVRAWGQAVGRAILATPARAPTPARRAAPLRRVLAGLCLFAGLTAISGGLALVAAPDGSILRMPVSILAHSPFHDFLVPGLLLFGVVGLGNTAAGILLLRRKAGANRVAFFFGGVLVIWIAVEILLLRSIHWLQVIYGVLGLAIQVLALVREQRAVPRRAIPAGPPVTPGGPLPHTP